MKRDIAIIPFNDREEIVIACDNSGSIGLKPLDDIPVSYETVSYFGFRVAWMECVAAGAVPFSVVIQNFCGDDAWSSLVRGIKKGLEELNRKELTITGSTETNFSLLQSAVSFIVMGRKLKSKEQPFCFSNQVKIAVIGSPLVGMEVVHQKEEIAPLELFQWFCQQKEILTIMPVGSKGILVELENIFQEELLSVSCELDIKKSAGPSTCFIVIYNQEAEGEILKKSGAWFHPIWIKI